jgi:hypothetical protein
LKRHPIGQALPRGAFGCHRVLFCRQGDPQNLRALVPCERERRAAPATADIENVHARFEQKLAGDMVLLDGLDLLQLGIRGPEVCAGILPVIVQKRS